MNINSVSMTEKTAPDLWMSGLLGGVVALAGTLTLYGIAGLLGIPLQVRVGPPNASPLIPLALAQVVATVIMTAVGATALYAGLRRIFKERARRIFQVVAAAVLILSFGAPLSLAASPANTIFLALMHVVTAAAIIWALTLRE
jgi:hypothetical protein